MTKRLLQGQELERRARELGVDIQGPPRTGSISGSRQRADDHELQQRVIEAERAKRESRLWLLGIDFRCGFRYQRSGRLGGDPTKMTSPPGIAGPRCRYRRVSDNAFPLSSVPSPSRKAQFMDGVAITPACLSLRPAAPMRRSLCAGQS